MESKCRAPHSPLNATGADSEQPEKADEVRYAEFECVTCGIVIVSDFDLKSWVDCGWVARSSRLRDKASTGAWKARIKLQK